jgi:hypothetical protein
LASARLYNEIALNDPQLFKQRFATVTREWVRHRLGAYATALTVRYQA